MNFLDLAKKRFTTKDYVPDKKINPEDMNKLKDAISLAPSAFGLQQARVIIFQTQEMREKIAPMFKSFNQDKINKSSACFVFIGLEVGAFLANNSELIKKRTRINPTWSDEEKNERYDYITKYYENNKDVIFRVEQYAASMMAMQLVLCATDLDYGSTIMTGIDYVNLTKFFKENNWLQDNENICLAVTVGTIDDNSEINKILQTSKSRISIDNLITEVK